MGMRIVTSVVACCMLLMLSMTVLANETTTDTAGTLTAVGEDPRGSILKLILCYETDAGEMAYYQAGTCFLINDEYVLTNKHVVSLDSEAKEEIMESQGLTELRDNDKHLKLYLLVNRDMKVAATVHDSVQSDDMDFAAVKLSEKIYDRAPIALGDSDAVETKDNVYAVGFPADSASTKDYNTMEDVSTVNGIISKLTETGNVDIIEHTAPLNVGNSGGPLLDESNEVIGINTFVAGQKNYSIQINYIKAALDTFGIPYTDGNTTIQPSDPVPVEEDNTQELFSELQGQIDSAKAMDTETYTKETVAVLNDAIGSSEAVMKNTEASEVVIQSSIDDLKTAVNGLEEEEGPNLMLIIAIVALVIIVILIVVIVLVTSGKKNKASYVSGSGGGTEFRSTDFTSAGSGIGDASATVPQRSSEEGIGETTLLDQGAGETTLLGAGGGSSAYLIRKKNGEKIMINVSNFKIGKERKKVNYCISDNTSVSRCHVIIERKGTDFYAIDQGATNFTFVNGVQVSPHKETLLSDQSVLKLSDEEFEFHLS